MVLASSLLVIIHFFASFLLAVAVGFAIKYFHSIFSGSRLLNWCCRPFVSRFLMLCLFVSFIFY